MSGEVLFFVWFCIWFLQERTLRGLVLFFLLVDWLIWFGWLVWFGLSFFKGRVQGNSAVQGPDLGCDI